MGKSAAYYDRIYSTLFLILSIVSESTIFIIIYEYIKHCKIVTIHSQITMFTDDLKQYVFRYVSILKFYKTIIIFMLWAITDKWLIL